ncbi:hypothetical protein KJ633_06405, partial [bacterium]|nr:hypothetical protein [bacterium]
TIHGDICLLERRHIDDFMKKLKLKTGSFHFAENRKFLLCVDTPQYNNSLNKNIVECRIGWNEKEV